MVRLAFMGDVMLGRLMNDAAASMGPAYFWGDTLPVLEKADIRLLNLECVVSDKGAPWTDKEFHFRALPWAIDSLKIAKIDYVSLANNHSLDFGEEALLDMLVRLDQAGIKHAGAGRSIKEAAEPAILECGKIKVAVISASDNEPGWLAGEKPGINFVPTLIRPEVLEKIAISVKKARENSDMVVFSDHWGPNMRQRPTSIYQSFAHDVMDLDVDIFHGHSAHIFQGIEIWEKKPILFDAGDFVDDYSVDPVLRNDQSFIFSIEIDDKTKKTKKITLVPTCISQCQVNLAGGPLSDMVCDKMQVLCGEFGTKTKREGRTIVITL